MKRLTMENGTVHDANSHHTGHRTEYRFGYGLYCHDCQDYITTYDP